MGKPFSKSVSSQLINEKTDPVEASMNPGHHESTPSSPPSMEPSHPSPLDSVHPSPSMDDPDEQSRPTKRFKYSDGSTPPSPPNMEPSPPSPVNAVHPSPPMDAVHKEIDLVQHVNPSKGLKSSESKNPGNHASTSTSPHNMEPFQPSLVGSVRPSPMEYIRGKYENIDSVEQIDLLIAFVENQQQKMTTPSEAGSCSSEGLEGTCKELFSKILEMANGVKRYLKQMPGEGGKLCSEDRTMLEDAFRVTYCKEDYGISGGCSNMVLFANDKTPGGTTSVVFVGFVFQLKYEFCRIDIGEGSRLREISVRCKRI